MTASIFRLFSILAATLVPGSLGYAASILVTSVTVTVPGGSNNGSRNGSSAQPYIDDVFLNTLTLPGGSVISASNSAFRSVKYATVLAGRDVVNAEYGDSDTGSDGNANPFVTAGVAAEGAALDPATRESTNPAIQDPAIRAAFGSLSLVQGIDGESTAYTLQLVFSKGIVDNSSAVDQVPELMFFERGVNSDFSVRLMIGGTLAAPVLHPTAVNVLRNQMFATGIYIDTIEITSGQQLGAAGLDLNDFGLPAGTPVYGIELTSINNSGADLYGNFLAAADPAQFRELPAGLDPAVTSVPEPATIVLLGTALIAAGLMRKFHQLNP